MIGASTEDDWMLSGIVVESEAEPESDAEQNTISGDEGSDMDVDEA